MCKKWVCLTPVIVVVALLCSSADATTLLDYDFGEGSGTTVTDLTGKGNDGTLVGFADISAGAGVFNSSEGWVTGGGLCFIDDGVRSYVDTPLNLSALPGDFTVEFEANYAGASNWTPAIGSNAGSCCAESLFFGIHSNQSDVEVRLLESGGPLGPHPWPSPPDTTVHHIALVYDAATDGVEVFVDGSSIGTATRAAVMADVTTKFRIGNTGWASSEQWDGVIFGVAISDQKLAPGSFAIPNRPVPEASDPDPADGAPDVCRTAVLNWKPGESAQKHDVYFGTNFDDVAGATTTVDPAGVYRGQQDPNHYPVSGTLDLEFGRRYYWRIDEIEADGVTMHTGDVWSFTAESFAYPVPSAEITARASSVHNENMGPENTIDGSGLDENDLHSTEDDAMWLSNGAGPQPTWIQYEFDSAYKLYEMWVWNFNQSFEPSVGFGLKGVTIEHSTDGTNWTELGGIPEFARGTGQDDYGHNTVVDFAGVVAKYVKITANSNWGGLSQYGLSELRFFYISAWATEPDPTSGKTGLDPDVVLSWRPGREAATHDVYFSTDRQSVASGTALVTEVPAAGECRAGYDAGMLELGKTYYWRIDEVNEAETPATWQGPVWDFTTIEHVVVDDFEDYNDFSPDRIWQTWHDGVGFSEPPPGFAGNGTGSQVGNDAPPFTEQTIVHGGLQAMTFRYTNNGSTGKALYSEAQREWATPQNWTVNGVKALTLWFNGDAGNSAEPLYVGLQDSLGTRKDVRHDNANAVRIDGWEEFSVDLQEFANAGVNLTSIQKIYVGVGNRLAPQSGGTGTLYFDDIRLYPSRCVPERKAPPAADLTGDCVVDYLDVDSMAADWLIAAVAPDDTGLVARWEFAGDFTDATGKGHDGTAYGDPTIVNDPERGQVLEVDGDDRVGVSDAADLNYGPDESLTLVTWANFEPSGAPSGWKCIVAKGRTESGGATAYVPELYGFYVSPDNNWHVNAGGIGGDPLAATGGRWRHLAFVQDGPAGEGYFYIDGEVVVSGGADNCDTTGRPLFIGAAGTDVPVDIFEAFKGRIDDVRIYNYALSQSEILYLAGLKADLYEDDKVDFKDYAVLADGWLDEQLWP